MRIGSPIKNPLIAFDYQRIRDTLVKEIVAPAKGNPIDSDQLLEHGTKPWKNIAPGYHE